MMLLPRGGWVAILIVSTLFSHVFPQLALAHINSESSVATLYRDSVAIQNARIHIATFDADLSTSGGTTFEYNWENCKIAAELFHSQEGVKVKYWCEKGFFRK